MATRPLPKEIQNAPKEDTVCKFCGVSYLVFSEMKKLEQKVAALEKELEIFKNRPSNSELETELARVMQEREELLKKHKDMDKSLAQFREKLNEHKEFREEDERMWKNRMKELREQMAQEKEDAIEAVLKRSEENSQQLVDEVARLRSTNYDQSKRLNRLSVGLPHIKTMVEGEASSLADLKRDTKSWANNTMGIFAGVINAVGALPGRYNDMAAEIDDLKNQVDAQKKIAEKAQDMHGVLMDRVNSGNNHIDQMKADLEDATARLEQLTQENEELKSLNARVKGQLSQTEMDSESEIKRLKQQVVLDRQKLDDVTAEMRERYVKDTKSLEGEIKEKEREVSFLNDKLSDANKESDVIRGECASLRKQLSNIMDEVAKLKKSKSSREKEAENELLALRESEVHRLKGELERMKSARSKAEKDWDSKTEEHRVHYAELQQSWLEKYNNMKQEYEMRIKALENQASLSSEAEDKMHELREQLRMAKKKADDLAADLDREKQMRLADRTELAELKRAIEKAQTDQAALERLQRQLSEAQDAKGKLQLELENANVQVDQLRKRVEELKAAVPKNNDRESLEQMEKHLIKLSDLIRQKDTEIQHLQATVHAECEERRELQHAIRELRAGGGQGAVPLVERNAYDVNQQMTEKENEEMMRQQKLQESYQIARRQHGRRGRNR